MFSILEMTGKDLSWINQDGYVLADTTKLAKDFIAECRAVQGPVGWDMETQGLSVFAHKPVGISLSPGKGRACYIPLAHADDKNVKIEDIQPELKDLLENVEVTGHNVGFDWIRALYRWGIDARIANCTLIQAWLLDSDRGPKSSRRKLGLEFLAKEKLGLETLALKEVTQHGSHNFALVNTDDALWYAGPDAEIPLLLNELQTKQMEGLKLETVYKIEMATVKPVWIMQRNGVKVDIEHVQAVDIGAELLSLEEEAARATGISVNLSSPDQVAELLFDKLKLQEIKGRSTEEGVLERLEKSHPVIHIIKEHRDWSKLESSFINKLKTALAEDKRLHLEYCQSGTRSGRFSSHGGIGYAGEKIKFNGQTWPKGKKINVRKALIPEKGSIWCSMDYSQIEYKTVAYISQQAALIEAIKSGVDFHAATAAFFFGIPVSAVNAEARRRGKTLNFGVVYGMTPSGLAQRLNISYNEAKALIAKYFEKLTKVRALIETTKRQALEQEAVRTEFGRIRWLRGLRAMPERQREALLGAAWNTRVQGTAADINKIGIARVYKAMQAFDFYIKLLSTVHDECNFEITMDVSPSIALPPLYKAMCIRPGIKPGWLGFNVDVQLGTSYGTLIDVPAEAIDKFSTWPELIAYCEDLELKKKQKREAAAEAQEQQPSYEPVALEVQNVERIIPAVRLAFNKEPADLARTLDHLVKTLKINYGLFKVYIDVGDGSEFLVSSLTVNPTGRLKAALKELGIQMETFGETSTKPFDPSSLTF